MCLSDNELQMLADNALAGQDRERALSHIKSCAQCGEQYAQIRSVFAFLESEPAVGLPAGFAEAVAERAVSSLGWLQTKRVQKSIKDIAVAMVVAIVLSVLLNWLSSNSLGVVADTLSYDLDTVDIPFAYAMLLFTLTIGVVTIDAIMYHRFNRLSVHGRDRK